jgi:hypothetical protein
MERDWESDGESCELDRGSRPDLGEGPFPLRWRVDVRKGLVEGHPLRWESSGSRSDGPVCPSRQLHHASSSYPSLRRLRKRQQQFVFHGETLRLRRQPGGLRSDGDCPCSGKSTELEGKLERRRCWRWWSDDGRRVASGFDGELADESASALTCRVSLGRFFIRGACG